VYKSPTGKQHPAKTVPGARWGKGDEWKEGDASKTPLVESQGDKTEESITEQMRKAITTIDKGGRAGEQYAGKREGSSKQWKEAQYRAIVTRDYGHGGPL